MIIEYAVTEYDPEFKNPYIIDTGKYMGGLEDIYIAKMCTANYIKRRNGALECPASFLVKINGVIKEFIVGVEYVPRYTAQDMGVVVLREHSSSL
jgi:hypothetical protein